MVDRNGAREFSPIVDDEYRRWEREISKIIGDGYLPSGIVPVSCHDVLRAHFTIVDFFVDESYGIGGIGPRSLDLLHSSVSRQYTGFSGRPKWRTKFEIAASLMFGIINNHPFHDANKRTALLSTLYFLYLNNRCVSAPERDFEELTVSIANKKLRGRLDSTLPNDRKDDAEIRQIAKILREKTRDIDKTTYIVTYRDLQYILNRFNLHLENPQGNYIDVVKYEVDKNIIRRAIGKQRPKRVLVAQVGFPGWSKQVTKKVIKHIRRVAKLDIQHNVDSNTFFKGIDDMRLLLNKYQEALKNLADR